MGKRVKVLLGATLAIAVLGISGAAIAGATGGDDDGSEQAITGQALDRASAAALEHTGGGKVTETEAGDEEGAYEVEVTLRRRQPGRRAPRRGVQRHQPGR